MAGNDDERRNNERGAEEEANGDRMKNAFNAEEEETRLLDLSFLHRSKLLKLRVDAHSTLLELGQQLVSLSGIAPHTLRLLLPRAPSLLPFSPPHSSLPISQSGITEDRVVRIMGALPGEINEVSQEAGKAIERSIIGFSEEDKRAKRWKTGKLGLARALPQGDYIFRDFRTLQLPGVELNPPAGRALEIMHKLASDPGIVAIMNKHRWRVGIMTELAPIGYVGVSPKCILGYNKNQGEEISLRLRTDDLKGFRKYDSIKQTLLHELAHMVHSEHDAHFHALNKQLNEEAMSLDWTKSGGQSLDGFKSAYDDEEEDEITDGGGVFSRGGEKIGGSKEHSHLSARSAAALAALLRLSNKDQSESDEVTVIAEGNEVDSSRDFDLVSKQEPNSDDQDPKEGLNSDSSQIMEVDEVVTKSSDGLEPNFDDGDPKEELNSDSSQIMEVDEVVTKSSDGLVETVQDVMPGSRSQVDNVAGEPEVRAQLPSSGCASGACAETDLELVDSKLTNPSGASRDDEQVDGVPVLLAATPELDRGIGHIEHFEGDTERSLEADASLKSLQESTEKVCQKVNDAILKLKAEASPSEAASTIQSLYKILRNLMEHPYEEKFKRLRKGNAAFQNRIARFKGAIEILQAVGFSEEPGSDSSADYLVLKRDDPVLLWLARSSLEACMA